MTMIQRRLQVALPPGQSAVLWGARKTGKSTLLRQVFPESTVYDFLKSDLVIEFLRRPSRLREQLAARPAADRAKPVILDEVQKVPALLDEVQWLIENGGWQFILCGSSARKLRRGARDLLGLAPLRRPRAWF